MNNDNIISIAKDYVAPTYGRYELALTNGKGCYVWDSDGKKYLDFVSGLAVCNLGHCHPKVVEALQNQAEKLLHVSNLYHIEPQVQLAEKLCKNSFGDKVFFCNSGTEAVESAIKLARKFSFKNFGEDRHEIISFKMSFHGRTMASLAATGQDKYHKGFSPLLDGFKYAEFGNIAEVEKLISKKTCAILVEPIQGEGGVNVPPENFLKDLRRLCDENELLLLFDEVQVGMGRTGKLWAYENYDVHPDIMSIAKGLAGGTAIGALIASDHAMAFEPGDHASTFGGNPLASAAGCAALDVIISEGFLDHVTAMGKYASEKLQTIASKYSAVKEIRGKGLIIGCEIEQDVSSIVIKAIENGILLNVALGNIVRLLPPLIVEKEMIDTFLEFLESSLKEL